MQRGGMIIRYASDIHLEFGMNSQYMQAVGLAEGGDVLLLAGDVAYLENRRLERDPFFDWCSYNFSQTIIVPGNHEYYRDPRSLGNMPGCPDLAGTLEDYEHFVRPNVRYLNNRSLRLGDVEVFATTLWTKPSPVDYAALSNGMNDFHQIRYKGHRLLPGDLSAIHAYCRAWLDGALSGSDAPHKIILTHHCPTMRREFDAYSPSGALYGAFHLDMEGFISEHDADIWIYGHTHFNGGAGLRLPSMKEDGTLLLCNQLGYVEADEQLGGFRRDAGVEV